MRGGRGFTLIEILVTVTVAAILMAIAVQSYTEYATRAKIAEAVGELASMRANMDEYFLDNRTFVGACQPGTMAPLPAGEAAEYFAFGCSNLSLDTYTVTATGRGEKGMGDFQYAINQNNVRSTLQVPDGWNAAATCWTLRRDGSC